MKEMFILLFCLGTVATVSAQYDPRMEETKRIILGEKKSQYPSGDPRDVVLGDDRRVYDDSRNRYPNYPSGSSRDAQVNQVHRAYDAKIHSIRNNRYLSEAEKQRTIRQLEQDRDRSIRQINNRYDNDRKRYDDDDYGKGYRKNNGKHYGWEKGKGNQKKYKRYDD